LAREPDATTNSDSTCDVAVLLTRIVDDQRATAANKQVALQIDATTPMRVAAPDSMVAMVIGNIVRNAVQHGDGAAVTVGLHERTLTVSNTGQIPANNLPHLFEPRFTTRAGGHGMGLYIARRICERYGWLLHINSQGHTTAASVTF
jgi:signal transduction histidine kinase